MRKIKITEHLNHNATRQLTEHINSILQEYDIDKIISNGNLQSVITYGNNYTLSENIKINETQYPIGSFTKSTIVDNKIELGETIPLYVDSTQKWGDSRIFFEKNGVNVLEVEVEDKNGYLI